MTGFRQRFVRPFRRLSRLVAGTAGGPCVGDPVSSRSLPVYLYSVVFFCLASEGCACPGRGDVRFSCADPMAVGSALVVYITTYVARVKLNCDFCDLNDGLRFLGVVVWGVGAGFKLAPAGVRGECGVRVSWVSSRR